MECKWCGKHVSLADVENHDMDCEWYHKRFYLIELTICEKVERFLAYSATLLPDAIQLVLLDCEHTNYVINIEDIKVKIITLPEARKLLADKNQKLVNTIQEYFNLHYGK